MTQSPNAPSSRPRRVLPIIPAIPRCLERKPKQTSVVQKVEGKEEGTAAIRVATEIQNDVEKEAPAVLAHELQEGKLDGRDGHRYSERHVEQTVEKEPEGKEAFLGAALVLEALTSVTEDCTQSPNTIQDFGIGKHGFKLPPPFYPRNALPAAMSNEFPTTDPSTEVADPSPHSPPQGNEDTVAQQDPRVNHHPLRAEVSSFHAHSAPSRDLTVSSVGSPEHGSGPSQIQSFAPRPTPPTNATSSPTQPTGGGYGHAHNISFFPPPPMSPNGPSSPTYSVYQGYAYAPAPHGYPLHTHNASQHSQSQQPYVDAYTSPGQPYGPQSPFYNSNPPFSTLGSQPPLTPSATPLETLPQQWKLPNGYAAEPFDYDGNAASQHSEYLRHYRSASHSTLKSDNVSSRPVKIENTSTQPHQYYAYRSDNWRTMELNAMQNARMNGALDQVPLAEHLLYHFNDAEYADCRLILCHGSKRFAQTEWALSSLLLAQSRKLRDLLKASKLAEDGKRVLTLILSDRFVTSTSVESALRVLYGMPPDTFGVSEAPNPDAEPTAELSISRMKETLAYAASGCLLHLEVVVLRGLQVASEIINWENLEAALSFGLESGLEREFDASSAVIPAYSTLLAMNSDPSPSSHVIFTPGSSDDPAAQQASRSSKSTPSRESYHRLPPHSAHDLLMHCLDFVADNFPTAWELDLSARPMADVDRLPITAESRSPLSKSRLSRIQFGSHPSEATAKSADRNVLISTILLSIPFGWLQYLLESVGEPISRTISSVIKERERRRHIVLQSKSVPWTDRVAAKDYAWYHAGYEEFVRANDDGELSISRRYTGIALDPHEESGSER